MFINITATNITAAQIIDTLNAGTEVIVADTFAGPAYSISIQPTEDGFTVTDTTGGDQDADTAEQALEIVAEFITEVSDEGAAWTAFAASLS